MKQCHDSIIITLSQKTIKERKGGYRQIIGEWLRSTGEDDKTWWYKTGNGPKHPEQIAWVFWVIKGRIRWRCRLAEFKKDFPVQFRWDGPVMRGNWFILFDFQMIPRQFQIKQKGFQGFRYFDSDEIPEHNT